MPGWVAFESIRLFGFCSATEWAVLPNQGGMYRQHPQLLEEWRVIFEEKAKYQKDQDREREKKASTGRKPGRSIRSRT